MDESTIVANARAAWSRLRRSATFNDWTVVAKALQIGRAACMATAKTNRAVGTTYNRAMGLWLDLHGLAEISGQERHRALKMLDQIEAIEEWRATLTGEERRRWNHPAAVLAHFVMRHDKIEPAPRRENVTNHKPAGNVTRYGKAVGFPQDMIERAQNAVFETASNDCVVVALAVLRAAIRGEADVTGLLDQKSRPYARKATATTQIEVTA